MRYDSTEDTMTHIVQVREYLARLWHELSRRWQSHDATKLMPPEKPVFDEYTPKLKASSYGSEEYKVCLAAMGDALKHHYAHNPHHPEHSAEGIRGMTLVDVVEMFCDWAAATLRHEDGDIGKSIQQNRARFGYDATLAHIFVNTAQRFQLGKLNHIAYVPDESTDNPKCKEKSNARSRNA